MRRVAVVWLGRAGFIAAALVTLVGALLPPPDALQPLPWDKADHFVAFGVVALFAAVAFPGRSLILIGVLLSGFGAVIELLQGLPVIHRDPSVLDWVADTLGIAAALAVVAVARLGGVLAGRG